MHGAWSFYRKDGTLMRSGSFRTGEQVGTWITYDSAGQPHKETQFPL
jgi:antitoxin component YwqK of YwqJK toxin-antitoxin module